MLAEHVGRLPVITEPAIALMKAFYSRTTDEAVAAANWVRRAQCGLGGHEMIRHFEANRISLECLSCGETTPGWTIHARS